MEIIRKMVCSFEFMIGNETIMLNPSQIAAIEAALETWRHLARPGKENFATRSWKVSSVLVRVDTAPILDDDTSKGFLYEVEGGPGGLGFMAEVANDQSRSAFATIAGALQRLGVGEIGWDVDPARVRYEPELERGISELQVAGLKASRGFNHNLPLILRSGGDFDIPWSRCLCDYSNGGGDKAALAPFGAVLVETVADPFETFPHGFALKPRYGTGTRDVYIYTETKPFKREGSTKTAMKRIIERASMAPDQWVYQPFFAPEFLPEHKLFRIWRLFAVWNGEKYQLAGGVWNARRTLKVHGASDTVWGPVLVP